MNVSYRVFIVFFYHVLDGVGGGYVIIPMKSGKECVVKHMLSVDWRCWKSYLRKAYARSITVCMLGTVAGEGASYFFRTLLSSMDSS